MLSRVLPSTNPSGNIVTLADGEGTDPSDTIIALAEGDGTDTSVLPSSWVGPRHLCSEFSMSLLTESSGNGRCIDSLDDTVDFTLALEFA